MRTARVAKGSRRLAKVEVAGSIPVSRSDSTQSNTVAWAGAGGGVSTANRKSESTYLPFRSARGGRRSGRSGGVGPARSRKAQSVWDRRLRLVLSGFREEKLDGLLAPVHLRDGDRPSEQIALRSERVPVVLGPGRSRRPGDTRLRPRAENPGGPVGGLFCLTYARRACASGVLTHSSSAGGRIVVGSACGIRRGGQRRRGRRRRGRREGYEVLVAHPWRRRRMQRHWRRFDADHDVGGRAARDGGRLDATAAEEPDRDDHARQSRAPPHAVRLRALCAAPRDAIASFAPRSAHQTGLPM